jgi:hypothetical protein
MIALAAALLVGCAARAPYEPESICRTLQASRLTLPRASPHDLLELSIGTPARGDAESAWAQQLGVFTTGSIGTAALVAGLIMGFATDTSQPAVRDAGYGIVGGSIGLFVVALVLGSTSRAAAERARAILIRWAQSCQ